MSAEAKIAFVVAAAENGVIGRGGRLPWRLPTDLRRFRRLTLGKPVIMGRKTFESIGRPLDGRDTIVLTRRPLTQAPGVHAAPSIEAALALARRLAAERGVDEIMVAGGEEVFRAALPLAARIYLTLVRAAPEGDTRFDLPDPRTWRESSREPMPRGPDDQFPADFIVLDRQA